LRLAAFTGRADGAFPLAGVAIDNNGNLYGTTSAGAKGSGTVFKIVPGKPLKTLYTFCSQNNCIDGSSPRAGLIIDGLGNLYGTTFGGGAHGGGAVFEITRGGSTASARRAVAPMARHRKAGWSGTPPRTSTAPPSLAARMAPAWSSK
jgi:uncharacterized repeat protein (TIGR03803 family)